MPMGMSQEPSNIIAIPAHWYGTPAHARRAAAPAVPVASENQVVKEIFAGMGHSPTYSWYVSSAPMRAFCAKHTIQDGDVMAFRVEAFASALGVDDDAEWIDHMRQVDASDHKALKKHGKRLVQSHQLDTDYTDAVLRWSMHSHDMDAFSRMNRAAQVLQGFHTEKLNMSEYESAEIRRGLYLDACRAARQRGFEIEY